MIFGTLSCYPSSKHMTKGGETAQNKHETAAKNLLKHIDFSTWIFRCL